MTAGAIFGTDFVHPGRLSWREDGDDHWFVGHHMIDMIYEVVEGTKALESQSDYDEDAEVRTYAFESDDRLVVFVAADDNPPDTIQLDIEGLEEDYISMWVDTLDAEDDPTWMSTFGVPDNPDVDESNEGDTYATGVRGATTVGYEDGNIQFSIDPFQIIRLVFAKTEDAADDLDSVSESGEIDLTGLSEGSGDLPLPPIDVPDAPITEELAEVADDGGGAGFGIGAIFLLPLMLFI